MIAVDTNVLIYAHRAETDLHATAARELVSLAEGTTAWGLPVFCVGEFIRVVTHRRILNPPSTLVQALSFLEEVVSSPNLPHRATGARIRQPPCGHCTCGRGSWQPRVRCADRRLVPGARDSDYPHQRPGLRAVGHVRVRLLADLA